MLALNWMSFLSSTLNKYLEPAKMDEQLIFGFREEWQDFRVRHERFLERFPHVLDALGTAFTKTGYKFRPIDKFVHFYGRLCWEDFSEVLLCCGNGYGIGALKLVRSLYEKAITLWYLNDNPEKLKDFMAYRALSRFKEMTAIEEAFGKGTVPKKYLTEVKERRDKECDDGRTGSHWSGLNFVAMAKTTGNLGKWIYNGYYLPLRHAHGTIDSLSERLEVTEGGGISFNSKAQRGRADDALKIANCTILEVLKVQEKRFQIPVLKEKLEICEQELQYIYRDNSADTA